MIRVLVTRPSAQAAALADALSARHLYPICVPTVEIEPADDPILDQALTHLDRFDWLVVTSANAVPPLAGRVRNGTKVAAVGPATARALESAGIRVDHVPQRFVSAEIAAGLGPLTGRDVLLAQADAATADLHDALVERGARVTATIGYRTVEAPRASREALRAALDQGVGVIAFASPSAVRGLLQLLDRPRLELARRIATACIGPVTAAEATRSGFEVAVVPERHVAEDLARAIAEQLKEKIA